MYEKVELYGRLGAHEYDAFDPAGRLNPAFRAYWRRGTRLAPVTIASGSSIMSAVLGLGLRIVGGWLRVIDPANGQPYPTPR